MTLIHISWPGPVYSIDVGKRTYRFELHRYFGPTIIDRRGEPKVYQPPERSQFWPAFAAWEKQGQRVTAEGKCIWTPAG